MEQLKLTFVNVGYGEAVVLECPEPAVPGGVFVMVIDGGSAEAEEYADRATGRVPLAEYLAARGLDRIDCMVSTHIHEDHICGLLPAARQWAPGELWQTLPPDFHRTQMHMPELSLAETPSQNKFLRAIWDYQLLCDLTEQQGGRLRQLLAGQEGTLCAGLRYKVLAPTPARVEELEDRCHDLFEEQDPDAFRRKLSALDMRMNNFSLVLRLEYGGTRMLLPGDTNCRGYGDLTAEDLRADLFKVGHHGQWDGASPELLAAVQPKAVVCCASSDRRYESAHPDTLAMVAHAGAQVYFSDCPQVPGFTGGLGPHRALEFLIGANGTLTASYLPE